MSDACGAHGVSGCLSCENRYLTDKIFRLEVEAIKMRRIIEKLSKS